MHFFNWGLRNFAFAFFWGLALFAVAQKSRLVAALKVSFKSKQFVTFSSVLSLKSIVFVRKKLPIVIYNNTQRIVAIC